MDGLVSGVAAVEAVGGRVVEGVGATSTASDMHGEGAVRGGTQQTSRSGAGVVWAACCVWLWVLVWELRESPALPQR